VRVAEGRDLALLIELEIVDQEDAFEIENRLIGAAHD